MQIDVPGPIALDEASVTRTSVLEGAGDGYLFELDIRQEIEAGRVIRILDDWTPPGLCLYYPGRRNLSAGVRAFLELARELSRPAAG